MIGMIMPYLIKQRDLISRNGLLLLVVVVVVVVVVAATAVRAYIIHQLYFFVLLYPLSLFIILLLFPLDFFYTPTLTQPLPPLSPSLHPSIPLSPLTLS
jgi:hypothetical protein